MTGETPELTKEKLQPSIVRISKNSVDKPISDRRLKQGIRVNGHPKSPSTSSKNKEAVENKDEEQAQLEKPPAASTFVALPTTTIF